VGYAIFVTNNAAYKREKSQALASVEFSMQDGTHARSKHWRGTPAVAKDYPDFELCQEHDITWHDATLGGIPFYYCMVKV